MSRVWSFSCHEGHQDFLQPPQALSAFLGLDYKSFSSSILFTSCEEKAAVHRSLESQLPLRGASRFQVSRLDLLTLTMPKFVPPHKIVLPHNRLVRVNVVFHLTTHILLSSLLRHQNLNKIATRPIHYETESETTCRNVMHFFFRNIKAQ